MIPKKERNKIYRLALKNIDNICFVCVEFGGILRDSKYEKYSETFESLKDGLPEFFNKEPKNWEERAEKEGWRTEGGWWPMDDKGSRIKALKSCIKQTNPKPKKK